MTLGNKKKIGESSIIGSVLDGRYEILSCLGAGGMGVVYKARQTQLDRVVAIKMPHQTTLSNPSWRSRFEREGRAMARFSHENIVQVFDFNIAAARPYIVLEFVQGQELADFLSRPDKLSMRGLAHVLAQIARGLDYAHQHNVIHRDIKPENIVISDVRRRVKIMDFGLARFEDVASEVTRAGFVVGTPHYMSPEQVRGKEVGPPSDIYSYAVILYCIFTGRLPFDGEGHTIMMKHASEEPPAPRTLNPFLPEPAAAALLRGLAKNPEARPESTSRMVEEIVTGLGDRLKLSYAAVLRGRSSPDEQFINELWLDDLPSRPSVEQVKAPGGAGAGAGAAEEEAHAGTIFLAGKGARETAAAERLRQGTYRVKAFESGSEALDALLRKPPQLLLVFDSLADIPGPALCRILQAHPLSESMPVLFVGERGRVASSGQGAHGLLQTIHSDEPVERIVEDVDLLFRRIRDIPTKPFEGLDGSGRPSSASPLLSFLTRLDSSLRQEETSQLLTRAVVRGDAVGSVFADLRSLLLPAYQFRHQVCAILPDQPGEHGTLLVDLADPGDYLQQRNFMAPIARAVRQAARDHKDLPEQFDPVFTKAQAAPDTSSEQTAVSMGEQYALVPIEDGPRLFGVYGVAYREEAPEGEALGLLTNTAPHAFAALASAWRRAQLATTRDLDEVSTVWRRPRIFEYLELSLRSTPPLEQPFCVLLLDVDHLDNYNETFGLEGGDFVLRRVGETIAHACTGLFRAGRVGGDEFMIVMPNVAGGEAMKFGKKLVEDIGRISLQQWTNPTQPSACAGIAFRAMEEKSSAYLVRAARNALKAAKASGAGKVRAMG